MAENPFPEFAVQHRLWQEGYLVGHDDGEHARDAEVEALKLVVGRHYPLIAGHAIRLREDGETVAAAVWERAAADIKKALEGDV